MSLLGIAGSLVEAELHLDYITSVSANASRFHAQRELDRSRNLLNSVHNLFDTFVNTTAFRSDFAALKRRLEDLLIFIDRAANDTSKV